MSSDFTALFITRLAFGAVAAAVFAAGQFVAVQLRVRRRVAAHGRQPEATADLRSSFNALISSFFDEKRFGIVGSVRTNLRRELVCAGFFRDDAINYYIFARMATVVVLTTSGYLLADHFLVNSEWYFKFAAVAVVMLLAVLGPDGYISRRTRKLQEEYR